MNQQSETPLLVVENLRTVFDLTAGTLKAVDGVSFSLARGKILGIVGESGSGKSVTGLSLMHLVPKPGRIAGGKILFEGHNVIDMNDDALRRLRGGRMAMVFQDPMMTLNPVLRIDTQLVETVQAHANVSRESALERARSMLALVGIAAPDERLRNYPHQLSGGMRQRIVIAIALCNDPDIIIADEPTTALDVTIQAQILSEVQSMCEKTGTSLIWITHDLGVVAGLADKVCVMYAGKIVESGSVKDVIDHTCHPYTQGLIDSVPSRNRRGQPFHFIQGMVENPLYLPPGCAFQNRCRYVAPECREPQDLRYMDEDHYSRCRLDSLEPTSSEVEP